MKMELWLIWKNPKTRSRYKIGSLKYENNKYYFTYINPELEEAINNGFDYFPGFEDLKKEYVSNELFVNIDTRLPNPSRPDYLDILNKYNLDNNSDKMAILKATRGRLITDNYEFVPAFDIQKVEFDVAGTRHCRDMELCHNCISINDKLFLELDKDNKFDKQAIKVIYTKNGQKYHIGYVPKYYSSYLTDLLKNNIEYSALVKNVNLNSELADEDITTYVKIIFK